MKKILEKSGNFVSPEKWEPCTVTYLDKIAWSVGDMLGDFEVSISKTVPRRKIHRLPTMTMIMTDKS